MLQPFDYDPHEKNKHKFMVQTMFAPSGPIESVENLVSIHLFVLKCRILTIHSRVVTDDAPKSLLIVT